MYCPLDVLLQRVEARNKSGTPEEMRTAFQSFEQFPAIYKIHEDDSEQIVDTVKSLTIKKTLESAIQDLIDNKIREPYVIKLQEFKKKFIDQFKLNQQDEVILVARYHYDLILNSGVNSVQELSSKIA